jgi:hypothetical protein
MTKDMTLSINYVDNEAHHMFEVGAAQNARGYWVNRLNPIYLLSLGGVTDTTGTKPGDECEPDQSTCGQQPRPLNAWR